MNRWRVRVERINQWFACLRVKPRTNKRDLYAYHLIPPLVAISSVGASLTYFAAAIGGFTDPAGHHSPLVSALWGLVLLAIGLPTGVYVVTWLKRPELPRQPTGRELLRIWRRRRRGVEWPTELRQYPPRPPDATRWQRIAYWLKTN